MEDSIALLYSEVMRMPCIDCAWALLQPVCVNELLCAPINRDKAFTHQWPLEFKILNPCLDVQRNDPLVCRILTILGPADFLLQPSAAPGFSHMLHISQAPGVRGNRDASHSPDRTPYSRHSCRKETIAFSTPHHRSTQLPSARTN